MSFLNSASTYFYVQAYLPILPDLFPVTGFQFNVIPSPIRAFTKWTVLFLNRLFENTYVCVLSRRFLLCANYLLFTDHFQLFTIPLLLCLHYCNYRSQKLATRLTSFPEPCSQQ